MKFLFIVQGEGRGHLTQAIALEDILRRNGHEVVEVLVGQSKSRRLPGFFSRSMQAPIKRFASPNFLPAPANCRVCLWRSVVYNLTQIPAYLHSMRFINRCIRKSGADVVVNFYELLAGLAYFCFRPQVPQVCIGHQYLFLHRDFRFPPSQNFMGLWMLRFFTRMTCLGARERLALSFHEMGDDEGARIRVVPPLLRREVLVSEVSEGNYLHGYVLNAGFGEYIKQWHAAHPDVSLHFFWDKADEPDVCTVDANLTFHRINDVEFLRYLSGCKAYATTAGFESVCEALYLGKPALMVPAHIEQECNAYDAARAGAGIAGHDFDMQQLLDYCDTYKPSKTFRHWARSAGWRILGRIEENALQASVWHKHTVTASIASAFHRICERVQDRWVAAYCNTNETCL